MKFSIVIEYNVNNVNDKELNKDIKFEYHKRVYKENGETKEQIYADDVKMASRVKLLFRLFKNLGHHFQIIL